MKLDIPLDAAVTITIDPVRKVLSITDDAGLGSRYDKATSFNAWNETDQHVEAKVHDINAAPSGPSLASPDTSSAEPANPHDTALATALQKLFGVPFRHRNLTRAAMLACVCLLGFMYARHSGPSAHPALPGSQAAQQAPSSLKLPSPPREVIAPSVAKASPNAAFGLD